MTRQHFVFFILVGVASFLSLANCQLVIGCIEGGDTDSYTCFFFTYDPISSELSIGMSSHFLPFYSFTEQ